MIPSNFYEVLNTIDGWLFPDEASCLFLLAKQCPAESCIVEIGSYLGKSAYCLAEGTINGNNVEVYSIDPHKGSPDILKLFGLNSIDTRKQFEVNLVKLGIQNKITSFYVTSEEAAKTFDKKIGLIFIDARHEYEFVKTDVRCWEPKVIQSGVLIFHDSDSIGPSTVITELLISGRFKKEIVVKSLTVLRKIK